MNHLKINCSYCAKQVAFAPRDVGARINCPWCENVISLEPKLKDWKDSFMSEADYYQGVKTVSHIISSVSEWPAGGSGLLGKLHRAGMYVVVAIAGTFVFCQTLVKALMGKYK